MKQLGLLGGIGPYSTVSYYNRLNQLMNKKYGGYTSSNLMLYSFNFEDIVHRIDTNRWDQIEKLILSAALKLENSGNDYILICSNTLHKTYDYVQKKINIPIIHILDPLINKIKENNVRKIAILGTKITNEEQFHINYLHKHVDVLCIDLDRKDKELINTIIFDELCHNIILKSSKYKLLKIVDKLYRQGAEIIVLACTEIGLLINESDFSDNFATFDTTIEHANYTIKTYF